jgi:cardiolipin synthase A/B
MSLPVVHYGFWLLLADWLIRIAALSWIPSRCSPASARSWLLLVGFIPLAGLPLYLAFGHPWLSQRRRGRQEGASRLIREEQVPLAALRWQPPRDSDGSADDIARLAERLGDFMPMSGNAVDLLADYDASLRALLADIDAAQREVHLLYYLMFDDAVGHAFADALQRAAARGVRCRVLLDAVGGKRGLRAFAGPLRSAGVEIRASLARGGLAWRRSARMDLRNHRKIAVVDGATGYVGSQNLAAPGFLAAYPNREVVARVRGPVLLQLAALFASDWYIETGEVLAIDSSGARAAGEVPAQLLPSGPAYPFENARNVVVALIQRARRRVVLATPYFVPDDTTLGALRIAALSGIEVQLILSRHNNQRFTAWAQAAYFDELLAAGVRIALYRPHFLHAKHIAVDDAIALVGSINLDIRSFMLNAEAGMLCYDPGVALQLRAITDDYLTHADVVEPAAWRRRPAWRRSIDGIARLADSFL